MLMTRSEYDAGRAGEVAFTAGYNAGWDAGHRGFAYHLRGAMADFRSSLGPHDAPPPSQCFGTFWAGAYAEVVG